VRPGRQARLRLARVVAQLVPDLDHQRSEHAALLREDLRIRDVARGLRRGRVNQAQLPASFADARLALAQRAGGGLHARPLALFGLCAGGANASMCSAGLPAERRRVLATETNEHTRTSASAAMNSLDSVPEHLRGALLQQVEQMQLQDSVKLYNELVETCFARCVTSFPSKTVDDAEDKCIQAGVRAPARSDARPDLRAKVYEHVEARRAAVAGGRLPGLADSRLVGAPRRAVRDHGPVGAEHVAAGRSALSAQVTAVAVTAAAAAAAMCRG
jgi:import inner membrane translocase subunit TIM9